MTMSQCPTPFANGADTVGHCENRAQNCTCKKPGSCYTAAGSCKTTLCCDQNGTCCYYTAADRDPFWPSFSHPRFLSCQALYAGAGEWDACTENGCTEDDGCPTSDGGYDFGH